MKPWLLVALIPSFFLATVRPIQAQKASPRTGAFDPEQVLKNMEQRVEERDWKRYADFLAPGFAFTPYAAVPVEYPAVDWGNWGRKQEIAFIRELVSPDHTAALDLLDGVQEKGRESQGQAEWDLIYTLETRGQFFRSRAIFVFQKIDDLWFLKNWIDTTIENDAETGVAIPTSGSLRGVLSR